MNDRDTILARLRKGHGDLGVVPERAVPAPVAPVKDDSPQGLTDLFVAQAEALQCHVRQCATADDGLRAVLDAIGEDAAILSWDPDLVPLPGLQAALADADITLSQAQDATLRLGLTGADAGIAATGSLVLASGPGKPRHVSLLPEVHLAVIRRSQIVATMEAWQAAALAGGAATFAALSTVIVISGASRTADIGMELVLGAHGPRELQIVIVP